MSFFNNNKNSDNSGVGGTELPPITTEDISHVSPKIIQAAPAQTPDPAQFPIPSSTQTPVPAPMPEVMQYPDEPMWSEEEKRLLAMAKSDKPIDAKAIGITRADPDKAFRHLKPPKKSPVKIVLVTLLIIILAGAAISGGFYFWWTNYATFEHELKPVVILEGEILQPVNFLPANEISRGVTAEFQNPMFIPVSGHQTVPLILHFGMRSLETNAALYVLTPIAEITHEFRSEATDLTPADLISNSQIARNIPYEAVFVEPPLPLADYEVGEYTIKLLLNSVPFEVRLNVTDTTAPIATPQGVTVQIGEIIQPEEFVTDVFDHSEIASIALIGELEGEQVVTAMRDQIVELQITDIYGNYEIFHSSLTVIKNEYPPSLTGVPGVIESMAGNPVAYPDGVEAFDDFGRNIDFTIDETGLNISETGVYTISYVAEDLSGLKTEMKVTIYIIPVDPTEVDNWIDEKLGEIIKDGMTQEEQVRAIFDEVRSSLNTATTELDDEWTGSLYTAAHYAINNTSGNYYHFYALSELMLTKAGINNMRIERQEYSDSGLPHMWNLVLYDAEGWFHYDSYKATNDNKINDIQHKFTNEQAKEIEKHMKDSKSFGKLGYYDYLSSLYPPIVESVEEDEDS